MSGHLKTTWTLKRKPQGSVRRTPHLLYSWGSLFVVSIKGPLYGIRVVRHHPPDCMRSAWGSPGVGGKTGFIGFYTGLNTDFIEFYRVIIRVI